jgi:DNA-binding transcriptional MerR regulator
MNPVKKIILNFIETAGYVLKKKSYLKKYESIPSLNIQQKKIMSITSKLTMTPIIRQYALLNLLDYIFRKNIKGDLVECGVWLGGNLIIFDQLKKKYNSKKKIYGYDTFAGMPKPTVNDKDMQKKQFFETYKDLNQRYYSAKKLNLLEVKKNLDLNKVNLKQIKLFKGRVEDTLVKKENLPNKISLLRLDTDWFESTKVSLNQLYPKLVKGGVLIIDDYGWNLGCKKATDNYFKRKKNKISFFRIDHEAVFLIK